jgi:hypothetical protein
MAREERKDVGGAGLRRNLEFMTSTGDIASVNKDSVASFARGTLGWSRIGSVEIESSDGRWANRV